VLGLQAADQHLESRGFIRGSSAHVDVVHELTHTADGGRFVETERARDDLEGDQLAHVRECRAVEVVADRLLRALLRVGQPEEGRPLVDEALDQPGSRQPVDPGTFARCPGAALEVRDAPGRDDGLLRAGSSGERCSSISRLRLATASAAAAWSLPGKKSLAWT
jgi:hypothetical protein